MDKLHEFCKLTAQQNYIYVTLLHVIMSCRKKYPCKNQVNTSLGLCVGVICTVCIEIWRRKLVTCNNLAT